MAVTYVSAQEEAGVPSHITLNEIVVNIGTRTNGLLVVSCFFIAANTLNASTMTYAGTPMSESIAYDIGTNFWLQEFYLANPSDGSNTLAHTYDVQTDSGFSLYYVTAHWYDGALQVQGSILDQTEQATGATDPSDDITPTTANQLIVSHYHSAANNVLAPGGNGTLIIDEDFGGRVSGCSYVIQEAATTETMSWAGADETWQMILASYKEAAVVASGKAPEVILAGRQVLAPRSRL